jgi:hypothetical protein
MGPKIPVGDEEQDRHTDDERFHSAPDMAFDFVPAAGEIDWWRNRLGEPFGRYPRELGDFLARDMPGTPAYRYHRISPDTDSVSLSILGVEDNVTIWLTGQSIEFGADRLHNDLTNVIESRQGRGFGKTLMANCFDLAELLGLGSIELSASLEAGPYVWAKFGFRPDAGSWEHAKYNIVTKLVSMQESLPRDVVEDVYTILSKMRGAAIFEIARQYHPVNSIIYFNKDGSPLTITLGRALLAESGVRWKGKLDLTDENNVAIFLDYVGR